MDDVALNEPKSSKTADGPGDRQIPLGDQNELRFIEKQITTDDIIHVSSVEFHEELNGTTPGAVKVGPKKRTQKNCKIQPKTG